MTVIVALHQNGETWIGADTQRSFGNLRITPVEKLVFNAARTAAIGLAGFERTGALVRRNLATVFASDDPWEIANAIRAVVKDDGYTGGLRSDERNGPLGWGCDALIATMAGVSFMCEDSAVTEIQEGTLWACGSGMEYALGAGNCVDGMPPQERVRAALETACRFDKGCGSPVLVHRLGAVAAQLAAE